MSTFKERLEERMIADRSNVDAFMVPELYFAGARAALELVADDLDCLVETHERNSKRMSRQDQEQVAHRMSEGTYIADRLRSRAKEIR